MVDLNDILGKAKKVKEQERLAIDGMCGYQIAFGESCYFPYDYGIYDPVNKKMTIICIKKHETVISWEMPDG
jgi:hypothetical protein